MKTDREETVIKSIWKRMKQKKSAENEAKQQKKKEKTRARQDGRDSDNGWGWRVRIEKRPRKRNLTSERGRTATMEIQKIPKHWQFSVATTPCQSCIAATSVLCWRRGLTFQIVWAVDNYIRSMAWKPCCAWACACTAHRDVQFICFNQGSAQNVSYLI